MTLAQLRNHLYRAARLLGDVQAVRKGRVTRRLGRRAAGRASGRMLRRLIP